MNELDLDDYRLIRFKWREIEGVQYADMWFLPHGTDDLGKVLFVIARAENCDYTSKLLDDSMDAKA